MCCTYVLSLNENGQQMKYILQIFCLVLLISSCKTTKQVLVVEEEVVSHVKKPHKDIRVGTQGKNGKSDRLRKSKVDPEQIVAQLNMSETQEKSFLDFWEKNQAEMDKLRNESGGDRGSMREKMKAFRESSQSEIEKILTPEQFAQYKQMLAKDRMKSRRGGQ